MSAIERTNPAGIAKPIGVWSSVVKARPGQLVFLSGFISIDEDGNPIGVGDMRAQTRRVCEQLKIAMESVGGTLADIVRVDVYTKDMSRFKDIHEVRREFFPVEAPASTMVEVTKLVGEHTLIEINAIAIIP